jgi:hypothetical protein
LSKQEIGNVENDVLFALKGNAFEVKKHAVFHTKGVHFFYLS